MSFEGLQALIIEDNGTDSDVIKSLLKRLGIDCRVMFDIREISSVAKELSAPNVIFLDLELPGANGYQILAMLKSNPNLADVPVVAYTSHLSEMSNARDAGFHSFLGKPLRGANFAHYLEQILNGQSVWEQR